MSERLANISEKLAAKIMGTNKRLRSSFVMNVGVTFFDDKIQIARPENGFCFHFENALKSEALLVDKVI